MEFTEKHSETLEHLARDMWYGNGRPAVTTRILTLERETQQDSDAGTIGSRVTNIERTMSKVDKLFYAVIVAILAMIGEIISNHIGH